MVTLYSTGCPKCEVLLKKLHNANIDFTLKTNFDVNELIAKGFDEVPLLEVGEKLLRFTEAVEWVNNQGRGTN